MFKGDHSDEKVKMMLNTIRKKFGSQIFEEHPDLRVTISIGFANSRDFSDLNNKELVAEADKALYTAKSTGRNKVVVASK